MKGCFALLLFPSLPSPSLPLFLPLSVIPLRTHFLTFPFLRTTASLNHRPKAKLVHSQSCLKNHWWQSFWVFGSACFTADRSIFSTKTSLHYYAEWETGLDLSWGCVLTPPLPFLPAYAPAARGSVSSSSLSSSSSCHRKSYTGFRLEPKLMTSNGLERHNK